MTRLPFVCLLAPNNGQVLFLILDDYGQQVTHRQVLFRREDWFDAIPSNRLIPVLLQTLVTLVPALRSFERILGGYPQNKGDARYQ